MVKNQSQSQKADTDPLPYIRQSGLDDLITQDWDRESYSLGAERVSGIRVASLRVRQRRTRLKSGGAKSPV